MLVDGEAGVGREGTVNQGSSHYPLLLLYLILILGGKNDLDTNYNSVLIKMSSQKLTGDIITHQYKGLHPKILKTIHVFFQQV